MSEGFVAVRRALENLGHHRVRNRRGVRSSHWLAPRVLLRIDLRAGPGVTRSEIASKIAGTRECLKRFRTVAGGWGVPDC